MSASKDRARIDRLFGDIPDEALEELLDAYEAQLSGFGWPELLRSQRILIVSEAGVGKTYECQAEQKRLWAAGDPAFFIELGQLAGGDLEQALIRGSPEHDRFTSWLRSESDTATFFLDSLDELKLQRQDFSRALRTLSAGLRGKLDRIRIVITTRPTSIDVAEVRSRLPVPDEKIEATAEAFADLAMGLSKAVTTEKPAPEWRQVRLLPLSDEQIRCFASNEGVGDVDAFMRDIDERSAEEFARRPQDLIELCAAWNADRRIRLHAQQVDSAIAAKLRPSDDRAEAAQLSDIDAREGASRLALAALLGRKFRFRLPGSASGGQFGGTLDPSQILPDWTLEQRDALLQRPLFGFASYQEVRFQHRSVIEYLAAERLLFYYGNQLSRRAVRRLIFATTAQGDRVVKPTMRATAAWMALQDAEIFLQVLNCEPAVLLMEGDPQSLSLTQRVDALRAFVGNFGQGGRRAIRIPWKQVRRFANPAMASVIQELWNSAVNPEIRVVLLNMIEAAKIRDCADLAFNVCRDSSCDDHERLDALDALVAVRDGRFDELMKEAVDQPERWPPGLIMGAIARHFPGPIKAAELDLLLTRIDHTNDEKDRLHWLADKVRAAALVLSELEDILDVLLRHVQSDLRWSTESMGPVCACPALLPALLATCEAIWIKRGPSPRLLKAAIIASRLTIENNHEEKNGAVRALFESTDSQSRALAVSLHDDFVLSLVQKPMSAYNRHLDFLANGPFDLEHDRDLAWVVETALDERRSETERELYISIAMWLGYRTDAYGALIDRLEAAYAQHPNLLAVVDNERRSTSPDPELQRMEGERLLRQEARKQKHDEVHGNWAELWKLLAEKPEKVLVEKSAHGVVFDVWQVMSKSNQRSRSSGWNRNYLELNFGVATTNQLRSAMMKAWRMRLPSLRSERSPEKKNVGDLRWRLGYAGLTAEAEDRTWLEHLTADEARAAARHVPESLSGFPDWFEALVGAFPKEVDEVLGAELTWDLAETDPKQIHSMLLQNLSHASELTKAAFRPRLHHWLQRIQQVESEHPQSVERLHRVVSILFDGSAQIDHPGIAAFLRKHLSDNSTPTVTKALLPIEMCMDPDAGIHRLEGIADSCEPTQSSLVVQLLGSFLGDRFGRQLFRVSLDKLSVHQLIRLIHLTYGHVRVADDLRHTGVFSPGLRDNAQDARRDLLNTLLAAQGNDAWVAKLDLARDPLFLDVGDYIRAAALETSAQEADKHSLSESEIYALHIRHEAPPTNRDDMFALMNDRIDDLEDSLLQDTTQRRIWAIIPNEREMRSAISNELQHRANGAYQIDQESITAGEKETDIRFRSLTPHEEGVIELKVGDKDWSIADYSRALTNQLVAQYMAPEHRRAGCLLITLAKTRHWDSPSGGKRLNFPQLIDLLQQEAKALVEQMGGTIRLTVRGLDLRKT